MVTYIGDEKLVLVEDELTLDFLLVLNAALDKCGKGFDGTHLTQKTLAKFVVHLLERVVGALLDLRDHFGRNRTQLIHLGAKQALFG